MGVQGTVETRGGSEMWLLLLVLAAGIWNTTDASGSIVDGLHEMQERAMIGRRRTRYS